MTAPWKLGIFDGVRNPHPLWTDRAFAHGHNLEADPASVDPVGDPSRYVCRSCGLDVSCTLFTGGEASTTPCPAAVDGAA